ncbi:MAG: hypothetical protein ACOC6Q_01700, partial [Patescibacteria group bacterium]
EFAVPKSIAIFLENIDIIIKTQMTGGINCSIARLLYPLTAVRSRQIAYRSQPEKNLCPEQHNVSTY